jgi:very-short-patch-repair endonuclease
VDWFEVQGIKVQGNWERRFAEFLVLKGFKFERHRLLYNTTHHYVPDFYIVNLNIYIEVKGWMKKSDEEKYKK